MTYLTSNSFISTDNSSTSNLSGNSTFTGTGEPVTVFESITINVVADVGSASGGISLQFGQSASNWDILITDTYHAGGNYNKTFNIPAPFYRLVYTNGSSAQSSFRVQCVFNMGKPNDTIVKFPNRFYDTFDRIRVSNPYNLIQVSHNTSIRDFEVASKLINNGTQTYLPNESAVDMEVSTDSGSEVIRQSRPYVTYHPGKSLLIMCTGVLNSNTNGVDCDSKIGLFDDQNGAFFSYKNGFFVTLRSFVTGSVVDTSIAQANWNVDKMSGTGLSGVILDATKAQIFIINLSWLGAGIVRFGVIIGGEIQYVHEISEANINSRAYMTRASLPIRFQISNDATTNGAGILKMICYTGISEGGEEEMGNPFSAGLNFGQEATVANIFVPVVSIRLCAGDSTYKRVLSRILGVQLISTNNANMTFKILYYLAPTISPLTGGTWANVDSHSAMEYNVGASAVDTTDAVSIFQGYFSSSVNFATTSLDRQIDITSDIDGNSDYIVLACQRIAVGGATDVLGSVQWTEFVT